MNRATRPASSAGAPPYGHPQLHHQYPPSQQYWPQRHEDGLAHLAEPARVAMPQQAVGTFKRCHCKKNKCLKLYCICFAAGARRRL